MRYLLDTNVCVELLRGRAGSAFERLRRCAPDDVGISTITLAELQYGAAHSARPDWHAMLLARFCAPLVIAPFDARAAEVYGTVRNDLERRGLPIGPLDTLIAAHALELSAILITANVREFHRIRGLDVENWL